MTRSPFSISIAAAGLVLAATAAGRCDAAGPASPPLVLVAAASDRADAGKAAKPTRRPASSAKRSVRKTQRGEASWYGAKFKGRKTASGERFSPKEMTAAHPSLPLGTKVRVTNLDNKQSAVLTVNDRLPESSGRVIDVTKGAANKLGFTEEGVTDVQVNVLNPPPEAPSR